MSISALLQLLSAGLGIAGSLFFTLGILKLTPKAIAELSVAYYGPNPHVVRAYSEQKVQYLFGAALITIAFSLQLTSGLVPEVRPSWASSLKAVYSGALLLVAAIFVLGLRATPFFAAKIEKAVKDEKVGE